MHFFRKEDHVGATPTGGPIYSGDDVAAAFGPVKPAGRVRVPRT
jgi:hypothetical protein